MFANRLNLRSTGSNSSCFLILVEDEIVGNSELVLCGLVN